MSDATVLATVQAAWQKAWEEALAAWSRFVQLHEPAWCVTVEEEKREQLSGSFAMIRLVDHTVVISLRQVRENGLEGFAREILAHEIGHHVYCPADLTDNARLLARTRAGLPTQESAAPFVANLYADLLINDRLQRSARLDLAGVYRRLAKPTPSKLWTFYMRTYESLWRLDRGTVALGECTPRIDQDAMLAARLVRSYARDWLSGAGRFAVLCLPYLLEDAKAAAQALGIWADTLSAGRGGLPDGLAEIDPDEVAGAIHPAEDPSLGGIEVDDAAGTVDPNARTPSELSGRKTEKTYRQPFEYADVLRAAGVELDERAVAARYYRERALPHLVPFPARRLPQAIDPLPEGLEVWDVSSPVQQIDWLSTLQASPWVIPGVTTRERIVGESPGAEPERIPYDLYLGVDCSGSMGDPARTLSYPVLAGAIIALSALRAGSHVKVVLSGEPGRSMSTDGFVRDEATVLRTLSNYLGTGYAFGIHRLGETFGPDDKARRRPVHVLIVSDSDMFSMLAEKGSGRVGWTVAAEALAACRGGGTFVLQIPGAMAARRPEVERLRTEGWSVSLVNTMDELVAFAREFSKRNYEDPVRGGRRSR